MTGNRVALEQFTAMPALPDPEVDLEQEGSADLDLPAMGECRIRPHGGDEQAPEADETVTLTEEMRTNCARLVQIIAAVEAERADAVAAATDAAASRVATVGADLLAHVIGDRFQAEIAATVADIVAHLPAGTATLAVAPDDHEMLAGMIAAEDPDGPITVVNDPGLVPGQARMCWTDGGADFDANDLTGRIAPLIAERLSDLKRRSET